ncbi:MAG: RagB/SusD family nutrient uptake outer membrane protein [Prevotellaceae bacterium]|jgi:hypothetical protein|nr:RagB/SusD family nutrient uptake outer membrane protein [Prevotellaceae bacterium]
MKKIQLLCLITGLIATSCGDNWLDGISPQDAVETEKSLNTDTEAVYAMNGVYTVLRNYQYYGARFTYYADAKGEDMQARGNTKRVANYYLFSHNAVNSPAGFWYYPYYTIRNVNNIIEYTDRFTRDQMSPTLQDVRGQALTARAMAHFDLVKVYGMPYPKDKGASLGVPIVTKRLPNDAKPVRNTVAEVYNRIIDDLTEGSTYIAKHKRTGAGSEQLKLNWYANQLLLSRAYLYTEQNRKAFQVAENLIAEALKDGYRLFSTDEYPTAWSKDTGSEFLFTLINQTSEVSDSKEFIGYLMHRSGYDDISLSTDYMDLIKKDPKDIRLTIIEQFKPNRDYLQKYVAPDYKNANIPVLRLAEAYLIAAEAAVKENDNSNALKYLNEIVKRANPNKELKGVVTLDRVLLERRKELVGEGHRFYDAMRNNQTIERKGKSHNSALLTPETRKFDQHFEKIVLPIPSGEINANPNIKQNPGYGI